MPLSKNQIQLFTSLQHKKFREQYGLFIIEGLKLVNEAVLHCPQNIKTLGYTAQSESEIHFKNIPKGCELLKLSNSDIEKISNQKNPQSVFAIIIIPPKYKNNNFKSEDLVMVLESVRDPGNLGTIIRSADWFGIKTIYCSEDCVDCYNPKVVQSTMGAIFRVQLNYTSLHLLFEKLHENQIVSYATSLDGENLFTTMLQKPAAIVMGNESLGLSVETSKLANFKIKIPSYSYESNSTESLNVAVAAAITLAEFRRRK